MKNLALEVLAWGPFVVTLVLVTHWTLLDWRWWAVSISAVVTVILLLAVAKKG